MKDAHTKQITNIKNNKISNDIKLQIKNRIQELGITVRALERKAGLNIGTVTNILHGSSSNPTAETLVALATAFDCSIDDLLNRVKKTSQETFVNPYFKTSQWNGNLFLSIVSELDRQIKDKEMSINSYSALSLIQELYLYSLKKNKEIADKSLVEWLLDSSL